MARTARRGGLGVNAHWHVVRAQCRLSATSRTRGRSGATGPPPKYRWITFRYPIERSFLPCSRHQECPPVLQVSAARNLRSHPACGMAHICARPRTGDRPVERAASRREALAPSTTDGRRTRVHHGSGRVTGQAGPHGSFVPQRLVPARDLDPTETAPPGRERSWQAGGRGSPEAQGRRRRCPPPRT